MKIIVTLFPGITALDAVGPYEVLKSLPQASVTFAALVPGLIRDTRGWLALEASAALAAIPEADLLLVPGGLGAREAAKDPELLAEVKRLSAGARVTASVCTGALILGAAGLLEGRSATTHWSCLEKLADYGARPLSERWLRSDSIWTAAGVSAGIDMALALVAELAGEEVAKAIQMGIEYDPAPPFDCGAPSKAPELAARLKQAYDTR